MKHWYFYALVAGHGVDCDEGLVQSPVLTGDGLFQVFTLLLDRQRIIGGYNAPLLWYNWDFQRLVWDNSSS